MSGAPVRSPLTQSPPKSGAPEVWQRLGERDAEVIAGGPQ